MQAIKNFWQDETGLELSEYALGAGLIAIAVSLAFTNLGSKISVNIITTRSKIKSS